MGIGGSTKVMCLFHCKQISFQTFSEVHQFKNKMHAVFSNDPIKFKEHIDQNVKIETSDGEIHEGTVYTIDPVSECIVLVNKNENTSLQIIFQHAVKSMSKTGEINPINLFGCNRNQVEDTDKARRKLKEWLEKNMIPIEESGDNLEFSGQLTIIPPYTKESCLSSNEIILSKIQNLIETMPS